MSFLIDCLVRKGKSKRPDDYGVWSSKSRHASETTIGKSDHCDASCRCFEVDSMKITDDDAAFILGKGGKTKDGWIVSSNDCTGVHTNC